jgi:hypothetical protein
MTDQVPDPRQVGSVRYPFLLTVLSVLSFVALLGAIIYFGDRLETLEDQLRFRAPAAQQTPVGKSHDIVVVDGQTVYVPVYSHIYSTGGEAYLLEATLSIRNTDPNHGIKLTSVRYFDTNGALVEDFLDGNLTLGPLETTAFLVEKRDYRGGSGANFIVTWVADAPVYEPIMESVMVGVARSYQISFTSRGRPLRRRNE